MIAVSLASLLVALLLLVMVEQTYFRIGLTMSAGGA